MSVLSITQHACGQPHFFGVKYYLYSFCIYDIDVRIGTILKSSLGPTFTISSFIGAHDPPCRPALLYLRIYVFWRLLNFSASPTLFEQIFEVDTRESRTLDSSVAFVLLLGVRRMVRHFRHVEQPAKRIQYLKMFWLLLNIENVQFEGTKVSICEISISGILWV